MCVVDTFFYCVEIKNNGIFASSVRVVYNNKNKIQYFVYSYIHTMMTDSYEFVLYMYRVCINTTEFLTDGFRSITPPNRPNKIIIALVKRKLVNLGPSRA